MNFIKITTYILFTFLIVSCGDEKAGNIEEAYDSSKVSLWDNTIIDDLVDSCVYRVSVDDRYSESENKFFCDCKYQYISSRYTYEKFLDSQDAVHGEFSTMKNVFFCRGIKVNRDF